jgi:hypothetical protein
LFSVLESSMASHVFTAPHVFSRKDLFLDLQAHTSTDEEDETSSTDNSDSTWINQYHYLHLNWFILMCGTKIHAVMSQNFQESFPLQSHPVKPLKQCSNTFWIFFSKCLNFCSYHLSTIAITRIRAYNSCMSLTQFPQWIF